MKSILALIFLLITSPAWAQSSPTNTDSTTPALNAMAANIKILSIRVESLDAQVKAIAHLNSIQNTEIFIAFALMVIIGLAYCFHRAGTDAQAQQIAKRGTPPL